MSIDLSQFHQVFFEESFEGLDAMESNLLELECETVDSEVINTIFRAAHSIKGGSGTFGFTEIAEFTHILETLLDEIREGSRNLTVDMVDLFLQSVDCLREMMQQIQDGTEVEKDTPKELAQAFEKYLNSENSENNVSDSSGTRVGDASSTVGSEAEARTEAGDTNGAGVVVAPGGRRWEIKFRPNVDMLRTGNEPARMFRELDSLGHYHCKVDTSQLSKFSALEPESSFLAWNISLSGDVSREQIEEVFEWVADDCELLIEEIQSEEAGIVAVDESKVDELKIDELKIDERKVESNESKVAEIGATEARSAETNVTDAAESDDPDTKQEAIKAKKESGKAKENSSIRVGTEKIDSLVNLVGELVITQSMLSQIGEDFTVEDLSRLKEGLGQLEHNTRDLQESVLRIRMLPINFTFSRFPRLIRDLSRQLDKKVELKIIGEETELDKTVMEKIGDPIVHLVRNSMDHGLESPEVRLAAGKDETGLLTLSAYHQGGNIVIQVKDDGAGLNKERILQKAVENGLVGEKETLSAEQINDLVFRPGFSTASEITDVSGRGVGMDVVRRNIQELNGTVEVVSEEGKGCVFTIRLPLTLAILDGQLIRVGDCTYILPLVSIIESLQVEPELVSHVAGGCEVLSLRDEYIPIVNLWDTFKVEPDSKSIEDSILIVLESENHKVGLVVDELMAQQQVVIKSMETNYERVGGVSGATILGDGRVSLILDIVGIVKMAGTQASERGKVLDFPSKHKAA
ncbi:MAG: chemotaxis protein CheA [Pseudomonadales bacterium]|nr:chemotaxis protein CheA [Pseudomonadales bacterium]